MATVLTTYPVRFANPRRDGVTTAAITAQGTLGPASPLSLSAPAKRPDLLCWQGGLVVVEAGAGEMAFFGTDGKQRWRRPVMTGARVAGAGDRLYFQSQGQFLEAVDRENKALLTEAPLPGLASREFALTLFWPRDADFVAVSYQAEPTYDTEDRSQKPPQPQTAARLAGFGDRVSAWGEDYEGEQTLPPLYVPETQRLILGTTQGLGVDLKTQTEAARFALPAIRPVAWSASAAGTLHLLGTDPKGRKVLLALKPDGAEAWRFTDTTETDPWAAGSPPVGGPGARVYALTPGRVLAIEAGAPVWQYEARPDLMGAEPPAKEGEVPPPVPAALGLRFGTSLADGSLLVVGAKTLIYLDATGKRRFAVTLDEEILAPPVPGPEGQVFLVTADHLIEIR